MNYLGQSEYADRSFRSGLYLTDPSAPSVIAEEGRYAADPLASTSYVMEPLEIVGTPPPTVDKPTASSRISQLLDRYLRPGESEPRPSGGEGTGGPGAGAGGPIFLGIAALAGVALVMLSSR